MATRGLCVTPRNSRILPYATVISFPLSVWDIYFPYIFSGIIRVAINNRWYRLRRWRRDYLRAKDFLSLLAALSMGGLAIATYSTHPVLTATLGTFYLAIVTIEFALSVRTRRSRDRIQGEVLWGLFSLINKEVFKGDYRTRFTLFKPDILLRDQITPWYRYFKGGQGPIEEAIESRAKYKRKEGMTGRAWDEAGRSLLLQVFPRFASREEFENHYINTLKIDKTTVKDLSDYMVGVRTMFCYAFVGHGERTLGILSLDSQAPFEVHPKPSFPSPEDGHPVPLDHGQLRLLLGSVLNVLESFAKLERRFIDEQ
jgi:hypothetical protein